MRFTRLTLALAVSLSSLAGEAQDAESRRRALIDQAALASRGGDHRGAIELLARASAMRSTPALHFVLAQEQQLAGRTVDAYESATRCLAGFSAGTAAEGGARIESDCRSIVDALRGRIGRLRIVAPTPLPAGLRVEVGASLVEAARLGDPLTLAPGVVRVVATASDGTRFETSVTVTGGGEVAVTLSLAPPAAAASRERPSANASAMSAEISALAVGSGGQCVRLLGGRVLCQGAVGSAFELSPVPEVVGASALSVGAAHACAVVTEGRVRCWGDGLWGAAGEVVRGAVNAEVRGVSRAIGVSAGGMHTCVTLEDGQVSCWGSNSGGQLGDGTTSPRGAPAVVDSLAPAAEVAAGPTFTCARLRDGTAACWGNNSTRQTAASNEPYLTRPALVAGATRLVSIVAAGDAACGLRDDGTVWCWGGDLGGFGLTRDHSGPHVAQVPGLTAVAEISAGRQHVCARTRAGAVLCWGSPENGVLGALRVARPFVPRRVGPMPPAVAIAAGGSQTCALGRDGVARCWGELAALRAGQAARVVTRPEPLRVSAATRARM